MISFKHKRKFLTAVFSEGEKKKSFCLVKGVPDTSFSNKSHQLESYKF